MKNETTFDYSRLIPLIGVLLMALIAIAGCGTTTVEWPTANGPIRYTESHLGEKKEIGEFTANHQGDVTLSGFNRSAQPEVFNLLLQFYEAGKRASPTPALP